MKKIKQGDIKIRKTWGSIKPYSRVHTSKQGKKGYDRKENKRIERDVKGES